MTSVIDAAMRLERTYSASYPSDILGAQDAPNLDTLTPNSITENTLTPVTIAGTGFHRNADVYVDGARYCRAHFTSATQVEVPIKLALGDGSYNVTVHNGDSVASDTLVLTVTEGGPHLRAPDVDGEGGWDEATFAETPSDEPPETPSEEEEAPPEELPEE